MSSEYEVTLGDNKYKVEVERLDEGGILVVKVGNECYTLKTEQQDDDTWTVNDTRNDYTIKLLKKTGSFLSLEIDDSPRDVEWHRVAKVQTAVAPKPGSNAGGPKVSGGVYPPMPGKITEVSVAVGDKVKQGQTVCILEAMKMFNELKAPSDGTVKEVNVATGSAVAPNDLLVLVE
jgi:biotin carboxyl carrier protein